MPQNFLSCDRDQPMLLPPDLRDWLSDDHLAWFVIEAIDELDLEPFYAVYRADGHGAAAHDPKMMVTLFAYAYAVGERSSRGIERRCREDVAFRVICANQAPDHATIARFRVRHQAALADLFGQVLGLCGRAGIVDVSVIAVDGTKLAAAASDGAIRSYEQIAAEILAEAGRIDAAEDEIHGDARGDELPEGLRTPNGRRAWLREAKEELERERAENPEPVSARARRAARDLPAATGRGLAGRASGKPALRGLPRPRGDARRTSVRLPAEALLTARGTRRQAQHHRSRRPRMKFGRNFIPAYNAQAVTTEGQIIVAAEITTKGGDFEELDPMISAAERELADGRRRREPRGRAWPTPAIGQTITSTRCASAASSRSSPPTPPETGRARPGSAGPMTSCAG